MYKRQIRVTTKEEFADAFAKAVKMQRPVVLDCQIDQDDKVWPMVAPGAAISEVFDEMDLDVYKRQQTDH